MKKEFAILGVDVQILTDCPKLGHRLHDITVTADDGFPVSAALAIEALKRDGEYAVFEGGGKIVTASDPEWVTLYLHELINFRVARHWRDFIKIHAASGSFGGKRFLLAGDRGAGKTTLITRMLFEGVTVYGDETVLLDKEDVIPFPRRFHLKEGTIPLVPQLVPICQGLTSYPAYYGGRFFFFDPTVAGFDWEIKTGKVDTLFYLEPCHEKETKIESCPDWLMVQKLLLQSSDFAGNPEGQIGELCHVVQRSDNFIIHLGELDSAAMLLKNVLA